MQRVFDSASRVLATGLGTGYSPFAPGTAGSALGVLLFWPLASRGPLVQLAAVLALFVVGAFASTRVARAAGRKDPGLVVVDEVAGQWLTLAALPFTPAVAALGFVLFRVMDVFKPWPARGLEALADGWGIMADDIAAGAYAHLALRALLLLWPVAA